MLMYQSNLGHCVTANYVTKAYHRIYVDRIVTFVGSPSGHFVTRFSNISKRRNGFFLLRHRSADF
jgi:hypothetical protein